MISCRDPSTMTEHERLMEIAEILARGYSRLLLDRHNQLASLPSAEPSCEPVSGKRMESARRSA